MTDDVVLYSDGGRARVARLPVVGRAKVRRFLTKVVQETSNVSIRILTINRQPAIALAESDQATTVLSMEITDEGIRAIQIVANPEKLTRLRSTETQN